MTAPVHPLLASISAWPEEAVAEALGVTTKTLANWRGAGIGPAFTKAGKSAFYLASDVREWLERQREVPVNSRPHRAPARARSGNGNAARKAASAGAMTTLARRGSP